MLIAVIAVIVTVILVARKKKKEGWRWGGRRFWWGPGWRGLGWRRGWGWDRPVYQNSCLNGCCDYDKCMAGLGCNWVGPDGNWRRGTPQQCYLNNQ